MKVWFFCSLWGSRDLLRARYCGKQFSLIIGGFCDFPSKTCESLTGNVVEFRSVEIGVQGCLLPVNPPLVRLSFFQSP
ncbi:MAG: hypothetical protein L0Z53_21425 [Acidobacteriales bacterium]|nr:hypothetical protein [Terriglobales bacterium]